MRRVKREGSSAKWYTVLFAALILFFMSTILLQQASNAVVSSSWNDVYDTIVDTRVRVPNIGASWHMPGCAERRVTVERLGAVTDVDACVSSEAEIELAVFLAGPSFTMYALKLAGDSNFHQVHELNGGPFNPVLLSDGGLLVASPGHQGQNVLNMIRLNAIASRVQSQTTQIGGNQQVKTYTMNVLTDRLVHDGEGPVAVRRIDISHNQEYAAVEVLGKGVGIVDLATLRLRYIATDKPSGYGDIKDALRFAISDDGTHVAVVGTTQKIGKMYFVDQDCGQDTYTPTESLKTCGYLDFSEKLRSEGDLEGTVPFYTFFEDRLDRLVIWSHNESEGGRIYETTVRPDMTKKRLTYLAMGDSYSSGEGDIERKADGSSYYMAGTEGVRQCHVSTRSYPFLLRDTWGIDRDAMKSVACSGAQVLPDYYGRLEGYLGQGERLEGWSSVISAQNEALDEFIPGRVPQLEFVKRYQPKILTLTGGGNDIGFSRILEACATYYFDYAVAPVLSECSYATKNSATQNILIASIDTQYLFTKRLIERIKDESPGSKVVLVGYPSFINDGLSTCTPDVGFLRMSERKMVNDMTMRLNQALQRAAYDTGASFVDIEQSLVGGRLCEGSEYMTGVWDWLRQRAIDEERFHPNAEGHKKIAQVISDADVYARDRISSSGSFSPDSSLVETLMKTVVRGGVVIWNASVNFELDSGQFAPNTTYAVTAYSKPKQLGTFRTNADGSIRQRVSFDGVTPGHHMVVLEGTGVNGEPARVYQFIEVHVSQNDADGDGIPNDKDVCQFMPYLYDEKGRDVCQVNHSTDNEVRDDPRDIAEEASVRNDGSDSATSDNEKRRVAIPTKDPEDTQNEVAQDNSQSTLPTDKKPWPAILMITAVTLFVIVGLITAITIRRHHHEKSTTTI